MYRQFTPISVFVIILFAACATTPRPSVQETSFAPGLSVELEEMTRLPSGVYVRDLVQGNGEVAEAGRTVFVYYMGWLSTGREFDAHTQPSAPISFRLGVGEVIRGWDQGIEGMRVGGRRQIIVPPEHGYGRSGTGPIPGGAVLVFTVQLVGTR